MELFLSSNIDISSSLVLENYNKLVVGNSSNYINDLLAELPINPENRFEILEAELILNDLLENFEEDNPFLKKYFIQREYSLGNRKEWFSSKNIILQDFYEEMELAFDLEEKIYDFLSDEYTTCYKFSINEFNAFLDKFKIKKQSDYLTFINNSSEILIF